MQKVQQLYHNLSTNALYRNSLFLVLSSAILSGCGFVFWLINARFYSPAQIGQATGLLSLINLIASFSILGIGNTLIRYLSTSDQKSEKLTLGFILCGLAAAILCLFYLFTIPIFTPTLTATLSAPLAKGIVFLATIAATYTVLFDSVFIAHRAAKYTLLKNTLLSIGKIIFPIFFVLLGGFGIVAAVAVATLLSVLFSFVILIKKYHYSPKITRKTTMLKQLWRYSFGNYITNFVTTLPTYVLPIYVLNKLGPQDAAFYYIAYMIANLLFTIPFSVSNSLVAEGSYKKHEQSIILLRAIKATATLLLPAIGATILLGKYVLLAFGKNYSTGGLFLLDLLSIASIFVAINSLFVAIFRIEERIKSLIGYSIVLALSTIGLSIFLSHYGLIGIGCAFLSATAIGSIYNTVLYLIAPKNHHSYKMSQGELPILPQTLPETA